AYDTDRDGPQDGGQELVQGVTFGDGRPLKAGARGERLVRLIRLVRPMHGRPGLRLPRRVVCRYLTGWVRGAAAVARAFRHGRRRRSLLSWVRGGLVRRFAMARVHRPLVNRITSTARHATMKP